MRVPKTGDAVLDQALADTYLNKLDRFRTYAYYHVLAVSGSEHLEKILRTFEDDEQVRHLISTPTPKDEFGNRQVMYANGQVDDKNRFFILCNGLMDVDLTVDSLTIQSSYSNPKLQTGTESLLASAVTIVIHEPQGVRFLNMFRQICKEFNQPADQMRLVIKTIFVGEYDDTGKIGYLLGTPPICGSITAFKVNVTEAGSVYTADFVFAAGGITYDPALTSSANGQLIRTEGSIQDALNSLTKAYTEDAANNLKRLPADIQANKQALQYVIEIDESIKQVASWNTKGMRNARTGNSGGAQPMVVPANISFEGAIAYIFEACADYLKQATNGKKDSFLYKIVSVLDTSSAGAKARYRIVPFYHNKFVELGKKMQESDDPESMFTKDDRVVIYDYIFTGKNTDIESFDMHIDEGLAYFQTVTSVETYSADAKKGIAVTSGVTPSPGVATPDSMSQATTWAIVGPGTNSSNQRSSDQGLSKVKEVYDVVYARQMSVEAAKQAAILRTRGHTGWLSAFSVNPYDMLAKARTSIVDDIPAVYINIMMPSKYTGQSTLNRTYEKFWYQGLWQVLEVSNSFNDGQFTTELSLLAIPKETINSTPVEGRVAGTDSVETKKDEGATPVPSTTTPFVSGSTNGKIVLAQATNATQLTKDFKLGDFTKTSTGIANVIPTQDILDNIANIAAVLQYVKDQLHIPITITSGYRSPAVNRAAGSTAQKSDHLIGEAVDFQSSKMAPKQIVDAIMKMNLPYKQLIWETPPNKSWVHLAASRTASLNRRSTLHFIGNNTYLPYAG
jgi:zinc D-Ala-D-Ala carboxypeptidase